jgi:hypothetical protein
MGVSQGTVIEYVTEHLLQAWSFADHEIKTFVVPKIRNRVSLLSSPAGTPTLPLVAVTPHGQPPEG